MCLKPCIDGFKAGCRPYLSIDSSFLTGKWNGQLAACNALDGHNWMFPIAIGMFQSETEASWIWFMMQLKRCIGPVSPLAIHTDACKGLENAVKNVFPHAEQRECFGHMWMNLIKNSEEMNLGACGQQQDPTPDRHIPITLVRYWHHVVIMNLLHG